MGALIHTGGNWLNVSQGKLVNKERGESLDGWQGTVTSIKKRSGEYNGEPKVDVILGMSDGKENVLISFNAESPFARGFFNRIEKCDLSKPIDLGVIGWDDDGKRDKAVSFCYIRQGGIKIEADESFPKSKEVKIGNVRGKDWSEVNAATDKVMEKMQAQLTKLAPMPEVATELAKIGAEEVRDAVPVDEEPLPF